MTTLGTKLIIESITKRFNDLGKSLYVIHSGDNQRGLLYIKTFSKNMGKYTLHYMEYDFEIDNHKWVSVDNLYESEIDERLNQAHEQDSDCWCIDVESRENPFADNIFAPS